MWLPPGLFIDPFDGLNPFFSDLQVQFECGMSGRPPGDFPQERFRTDLSELQGIVGPRMQAILEGLLDPHTEDRMTAAQALSVLRGEQDRALSSRYDHPALYKTREPLCCTV